LCSLAFSAFNCDCSLSSFAVVAVDTVAFVEPLIAFVELLTLRTAGIPTEAGIEVSAEVASPLLELLEVPELFVLPELVELPTIGLAPAPLLMKWTSVTTPPSLIVMLADRVAVFLLVNVS